MPGVIAAAGLAAAEAAGAGIRLPRAPPAPRPSAMCPLAPPAGAESMPAYHIVVLASPRVHQGRYLATTLLSVAAADARPTTVTLLWAAHRRQPHPPQLPQPQAPKAPQASQQPQEGAPSAGGGDGGAPSPAPAAPPGPASGGGSSAGGAASGADGGEGGGAGGGDGEAREVLVQRIEMPKPPPSPPPSPPPPLKPTSRPANPLAWFSLLDNLALYEDHHDGQPDHHHVDGHGGSGGATQGPQQRGRERDGADGHAPGGSGSPWPRLRVRYLPESVPEGDVMANYYQALLVPDQIASELGDEHLKELPLLVLEGDVLLAPHFAARMACALRMIQGLGVAGAAAGGHAHAALPDFALSLYDPGMVPQAVPDVMRIYEQHRRQQQQQRQHQAEGGQQQQGGQAGHAEQMWLVPSLWSWGSQGLLYSYGIRVSLMYHYRELLAGCAPQDGLQDIELDRHMQSRGCVGVPPLPPVTSKPRVTGPACDPRVVHGNASGAAVAHGGGGACYLFTAQPAMVQHVGASSALFGAVSSRYHMTLNFPDPVSIPGLDTEGAW
ncbi:hypothetical protein GPECTOR_9g598 [Gonium pectorale]|uniref:Uncharacterized protein n=1 Tax=Gonium pectorale TaxID=33097 RepID=A0A150GS15_GONPE|nr:hypothetical protein GPECTOR_9g598 [Gonium pectorale]|eukprot:KXZ52554.1 hypothetical protein GPECTOR_9g598 [Gonium pectorale]